MNKKNINTWLKNSGLTMITKCANPNGSYSTFVKRNKQHKGSIYWCYYIETDGKVVGNCNNKCKKYTNIPHKMKSDYEEIEYMVSDANLGNYT